MQWAENARTIATDRLPASLTIFGTGLAFVLLAEIVSE